MLWQKSLGTIVALALLVSCSSEKKNSSHPSESEIRKNAQELTQAFNQHNPEKIGALWTKDGVFFHPLTRQTSHGREEIINYYKAQFARLKDAKLEVIVDKVEGDGSDKAVETGLFRISLPDRPSMQSAFRALMTRENGKWLIQEVTNINLEQAPSQYDHLKEIDWLVGDWIDEDENIEITFTTKWDKFKNFLTQHFATKILDQVQLEGQQVIAWDPIKKKIHSWVFDSDGGFGEGSWEKRGDSWFANMAYTLADGRRASATHIYTKIDDNSYTFAAVGRDVAGEVLPDIDPVKVERKQ